MVEGGKSLPMELEFSTLQGAKGRWPSRPHGRCQISVSLSFRARKMRRCTSCADAHGLFARRELQG